ncbi:MAG TPA: hypothetical protein DCS07_18305 [Bdellovibrionales bacterium]|nr:MAG: hypothetical protein A2Z97_03055 [Bdellovibrionales bacterium GWB1_52_6]OFZ06358.1 MAG: hypothetical protein A2X97_02750 [Bdellovibrionales bacterium GWA1_52_35]OFZ43792.1 MAG: hypothetical protein A2070_08055 [Bdellovibrionales bacterium GWC1_52_8]HAR44556.1 hypothetical protein [Bdellovibrionales bacterium]HCM40111.1 hypothetical protein [Bdellovibrionales bacterium]
MKSLITIAVLTLFAFTADAAPLVIPSLSQTEAKIDIARVMDSTVLGQNESKDIKVRLITVDNGKSTDVSPRYRLLLTYFHAGETNNVQTAFELGSFYEVLKTSRVGPGIYRVNVKQWTDSGKFEKVSLTINTTQVFIDDNKLMPEEFQDPYFSSSISVEQSN